MDTARLSAAPKRICVSFSVSACAIFNILGDYSAIKPKTFLDAVISVLTKVLGESPLLIYFVSVVANAGTVKTKRCRAHVFNLIQSSCLTVIIWLQITWVSVFLPL